MKLVSGSSFLYKSNWPSLLFNGPVNNVAKDALCNWYISSSIMQNYNSDVEFVYVQFTYINKISCIASKQSYKILEHEYIHHDKNVTWIPSGGIWSNWVEQDKSEYQPVFKNYYHGSKKDTLQSTNWYSLYHVTSCLNFLEKKQVPYLFGWDYDPFASSMCNIGGSISQDNEFFDQINWSKCVKPFMFDFCESIDELSESKTHPTTKGCELWVEKVKDQFVL